MKHVERSRKTTIGSSRFNDGYWSTGRDAPEISTRELERKKRHNITSSLLDLRGQNDRASYY